MQQDDVEDGVVEGDKALRMTPDGSSIPPSIDSERGSLGESSNDLSSVGNGSVNSVADVGKSRQQLTLDQRYYITFSIC